MVSFKRYCVLAAVFSGLCIAASAQDRRKEKIIPSAPGTTYALVVGISDYTRLPTLQFAAKDADLFRQYLLSKGGGVKEENLLYLTNEDAKGGALNIRAMNWLDHKSYKRGDALFIYLAGHGDATDADDYFFLGSDITTGGVAIKNNYKAGFTLQMPALKAKMKKIASKGVNVTLIVDACRKDSLPGGTAGQRFFAKNIMDNNAGEILLMAARPGQKAIESLNIGGGHGLFTWYLVDGLSGEADADASGTVDLQELSNYITMSMKGEFKDNLKGEQEPVICCKPYDGKIMATVDNSFHTKWVETRNTLSAIDSFELAAFGPKATEEPTMEVAQRDLVRHFKTAVKENRFTGSDGAQAYYNQMKADYPKDATTEDAKYILASAALDFVAEKIYMYLDGEDHPVIVKSTVKNDVMGDTTGYSKLLVNMPYKNAADRMSEVLDLLKDDPSAANRLQPKYLFLKARSAYELYPAISIAEAMRSIKRAINLQPDAAYLYNCLGYLLLSKNSYAEAEDAMKQAQQLAPTWSYPYVGMGNIYRDQKEYNKAEVMYKKAIMLDSNFIPAYTNLGNMYADQKKFDDAATYYNTALQMDPNNWSAQYGLGNTYKAGKDYTKAADAYGRALAADTMNSLAYIGLGDVTRQDEKKLAEAETWYKKAIVLNEKNSNAHSGLGEVYYATSDSVASENEYKRALELNPNNTEAYMGLGDLYFNTKYQKAIINYKKTISLDPAQYIGPYNLACLYAKHNSVAEGMQYLEEAMKKGKPYNEIIADDEIGLLTSQPEFKRLLKRYFPNATAQ